VTDGLALSRSLLGLVVVLGLLGLLAWLARRGTLALPGQRRGSAAVRVETAVPLGERRSLVIIAVEGRRLLLGLTPAQVSLVTELAPPAAFDATLDRSIARKDPS
jgi:flagellar protein FliO/FliZ